MRIKDFQGGGYILNKARRLLIPYFSVSIAYIPLRLFASQMASSTYSMRDIWKIFLGVSPNGGAWFLYVLFLFNLMTFIFTKEEHLKIVVIISFVISLLTKGKILNIEFSVLRYVCFNYFFFVSGLLCAIDKKINFKKKISESRLIYQISAFVIIYIIFQYLSCYIFSTILGTIGVSIVLSISYKISETVLKYREVLAQLGQDSMYIYYSRTCTSNSSLFSLVQNKSSVWNMCADFICKWIVCITHSGVFGCKKNKTVELVMHGRMEIKKEG